MFNWINVSHTGPTLLSQNWFFRLKSCPINVPIVLFAFCSWNWNEWLHNGLFQLENYFSVLPLRYLCTWLVIKQASKQQVSSSFKESFSFPLTHTTDIFDCFFISFVFVIYSWLLECCFSVFVKYLLCNSLVSYLCRIIVGNFSKCCWKVLNTHECRAKYSSKWLKWNRHDSL